MHPWEAGKRVWNSRWLPQWGIAAIVSPGVYFCVTKMQEVA